MATEPRLNLRETRDKKLRSLLASGGDSYFAAEQMPTALRPIRPKVELFSFQEEVPSCVYFLMRERRVSYVGKSITLFNRLRTHLCERKKFDAVFFYPVPEKAMAGVEDLFIRLFLPPDNREYGVMFRGNVQLWRKDHDPALAFLRSQGLRPMLLMELIDDISQAARAAAAEVAGMPIPTWKPPEWSNKGRWHG